MITGTPGIRRTVRRAAAGATGPPPTAVDGRAPRAHREPPAPPPRLQRDGAGAPLPRAPVPFSTVTALVSRQFQRRNTVLNVMYVTMNRPDLSFPGAEA